MPSQLTVRLGSTGSAVTLLQQRLTAKGFTVKVDGSFGPSTLAAVEQFQASSGLTADGVVGPLTWSFLMSTGQAATPHDVLDEQRAWLVSQIPASVPTASNIRPVLKAACYKLGCKEVPDGSNGGPEIADIVSGGIAGSDGKPPSAYYQHWGIKDPNTLATLPPWCALFVCWALKMGLGAPTWKDIPFGNWLGGVSQIEDWAKKNGKWYPASTVSVTYPLVPSGAIFTISRDGSGSDAAGSTKAGHTGFVVCDNGDGTITTVEGNVANEVGSHKRSKSGLRGYVIWW